MDLKLNFASLFVLSSHGTCCNRKFYLHPFGRNIQDLSIPTFALSGSGMSASFNRRHRQFLPLCGCHFGPLSECGQPSLNLDNQLSLGKDSNLALNLIATPQRHPWQAQHLHFDQGIEVVHRQRPNIRLPFKSQRTGGLTPHRSPNMQVRDTLCHVTVLSFYSPKARHVFACPLPTKSADSHCPSVCYPTFCVSGSGLSWNEREIRSPV